MISGVLNHVKQNFITKNNFQDKKIRIKNFLSIFVVVMAFLISSKKRSKENTEENCSNVAVNLVPRMVKDSFANKYPSDSLRTWSNKDNAGFCAHFTSSGIGKLSRLSENGYFIKTEIENKKK